MRKLFSLAAGALVGALLLSVVNGVWSWGSPYWVVMTVGAIAGLGAVAGYALLRGEYTPGANPPVAEEKSGGTITLREERLDIQKDRVEVASIEVRRESVTEEQLVTVPVTREEMVVFRNGVETVRIPLKEERVEVHKKPVVLQDVKVYTEQVESEEIVEETLKRETARLEIEGQADTWERSPEHP